MKQLVVPDMPTGPETSRQMPDPIRHFAGANAESTVFSRLPRPYETSFICGGSSIDARMLFTSALSARKTVPPPLPMPNAAWASSGAQFV